VGNASADASQCTIDSTQPVCLASIQSILDETAPYYITYDSGEFSVSNTGNTYAGDSGSTSDLWQAMWDDGLKPSLEELLAKVPDIDPYLAFGPGGIPRTVQGTYESAGLVSHVALAFQYGAAELDQSFAYGIPSLGTPVWVHFDNRCEQDGGGVGPGWTLEWAGTDSSWQNYFGTSSFADTVGSNAPGNTNPAAYYGCGITWNGTNSFPGPIDGPGQTGIDLYTIAHFIEHNISTILTECPAAYPSYQGFYDSTYNGPKNPPSTYPAWESYGTSWYALSLSDTEMNELFKCLFSGVTPASSGNDFDITVPNPSAISSSDGPFRNAMNQALISNNAESAPGGNGCSCADPPPLNSLSFDLPLIFSPSPSESIDSNGFTELDWTGNFPFGVFTWIGNIFGSFSGDPQPVSFTLPLFGNDRTITLQNSSWEDTYRPIVFPILEFLIVAAGTWVFAFRIIGIGHGESGDGE
jgi:hypothetical protein